MDLEDWEYIQDDDDGGGVGFMGFDDCTIQAQSKSLSFQSKSFIDMNYFEIINDQINDFSKFIESPDEVTKTPFGDVPKIESLGYQFADMKLDSPKSMNKGIIPQIDPGTDRFEEICADFNYESVVEEHVHVIDEERVSQVLVNKTEENEFVDMKSESPLIKNGGFSPRIDEGMGRIEKGDDFDGECESVVEGEVELKDEDVVSQVMFNKTMDNEFVDMKSESPVIKNQGFSARIVVGMDWSVEKGGEFDGECVVEGEGEFKDEQKVSLVLFDEMKENEFVDMTLVSPRDKNTGSKIDVASDRFEVKDVDFSDEEMIGDDLEQISNGSKEEEVLVSEENNGCLNMLKKWGMCGVGAFCTFGFAAATICMIVLSSGQREDHHHQIPKIRYQIYTDDKRFKQVMHHATRLNETISAVRGTHMTRAHITVGGYFEGF